MLFYCDLVSSPVILNLGKVCFFDTMVLSLIIGIGGRLIPGILGFQEVVQAQRKVYEAPKPFLSVIPKAVFLLALLFIVSIFLEVIGVTRVGYFLRAIVVTYAGVVFWRIHKKPPEWKWHGFYIMVACWFIVSASWLLVFIGSHQIALKHLSYIGGYSLLTFLVASRVILAHGTSGLGMEKGHFPFTIVGLLIALAAVTRASANFIPAGYTSHLGFAALCFFVGAIVWGGVFLPKILKGIF